MTVSTRVRTCGVRTLTSRYGRAPAKSLSDEGTEYRHFRHVAESDHAIAENSVDLLVQNRLILRVVTKRETETLHGRSYGQSACDTMHTHSIGSLEIRIKLPGRFVLKEGSHP